MINCASQPATTPAWATIRVVRLAGTPMTGIITVCWGRVLA